MERAKTAIEEGEKLVLNRQKMIKIADRSEHGWATVEEYEDDELADDSDDEKRLLKAEARAGRKLKQKVAKTKSKKNFKKPNGWWSRVQVGNTGANANAAGLSSQGQFSGVKVAQAVPQSGVSQLGPCFVCGGMGHFKNQCPVWLRAQSNSNGN